MLSPDYQTPQRMAAKAEAIPFPYCFGDRVLDVGCDFGYWSFLAAQKGATRVVGLDRNREVRGIGHVNLVEMNNRRAADEGRGDRCFFFEINLGRQWRHFGTFDVILVMSVYHHIFEQCGDHAPIWYWLRRHCAPKGAVLIWEGPVDDSDPVVRRNVSDANRSRYTRERILEAASRWFDAEYIGPARHEPTREVWRFKPKTAQQRLTSAYIQSGAGGATPCFNYAAGRRIREIEAALGFRPYPGSLNLVLERPFDWDDGYYRAQILDVKDRSAGLDSEWVPRWARFYPLPLGAVTTFAFRFEGERYDNRFMELIAPVRLRDVLDGPKVMLAR